MKKLLVLTDFSANAEHAAEMAIMLAGKLHANLLLYNAYDNHPIASYVDAAGPWSVMDFAPWEDEINDKLLHLTEYLEPKVKYLAVNGYKPSIHYMCSNGGLGDNLTEVNEEKDIELIVMGAKSGNVIDHFINGSDVNAVLNQTNRPVLIVPPGSKMKLPSKVIFATAFDEADLAAIKYLAGWATVFNWKLVIIHIALFGKKGTTDSVKEIQFMDQLFHITTPQISYLQIRGKNFMNTLNRICEKTGPDILAMTHHHHSYFKRLTTPGTVEKTLSNQRIPIMVFPVPVR